MGQPKNASDLASTDHSTNATLGRLAVRSAGALLLRLWHRLSQWNAGCQIVW